MSSAFKYRPEWDYSEHAKYYRYRPNYSPKAINQMLTLVENDFGKNLVIADVGAGTGNLTKLINKPAYNIFAIEPNDHMRAEGVADVKSKNIHWSVGSGEATGLDKGAVHLFAMGSSFNTTERKATLAEAHRVLKDDGWFCCMWNNRDLNLPHQELAEKIIKKQVPNYSHGTRREDQSDILKSHPGFHSMKYIEITQDVKQTLEDYLMAWRSVKNNFWDMNTPEGKKLYGTIETHMRNELPKTMELRYTTRIWMIKRK